MCPEIYVCFPDKQKLVLVPFLRFLHQVKILLSNSVRAKDIVLLIKIKNLNSRIECYALKWYLL